MAYKKEQVKKWNVEELIERLSIRKVEPGMIGLDSSACEKDALPIVKERKPEILAFFAEEERLMEERKLKIEAIEGLKELKKARNEWYIYMRKIEKSFEGDDACGMLGVGKKPEDNLNKLCKQYPRAAAYIEAEAYELSDHWKQYSAGKKAKERIINGEDYEMVIADMKKEWSDYCMNQIWD